jgi:ribosome-binding protein aMBF1 (putative translation factor)
MNGLTDYQTIYHEGRPAFVLVPAADFERIRPLLEQRAVRDAIPQAVVEAHVLRDLPLVRAWREHLGLTQQQVADRAGMKQPALARIEQGESTPRAITLQRLAEAMGLSVAQLTE